MSVSVEKRKPIYYVHTAIVLLLMFGFGYLPTFGQGTPVGMKVLGVFFGMLYGWIAIEMIWPSALGLIAFGMSGYMTVGQAFSGGFGHNMVLTVASVLLFSELLNQCQITDYLAAKCLSSKWVIGKPWRLVILFFFTNFLISVLASNVAACFILWAAFIKVAQQAGYQKGDMFVSYMLCSILFVGVIALMILPYKTAAILYCGFFTKGTGMVVEYIPYFAYMFILFLVQTVILLLIGRFVLHLDLSKLGGSEDTFAYLRGKKATREQKIGLVIIFSYIILLFAPGFLPKEWSLTQLLSNWGIIGVSVGMCVIGCILKNSEGGRLTDLATICRKGLSWDILWLLAATYPVAGAMESADCGVMATVLAFVNPLLQGMSPLVFVIVCMVVLCLLTQVAHNVILGVMFIPVLCQMYAGMGGNPYVMFFALYMALQAAYATPAASMQAAMMFGNEWILRKHGYFFGILFMVITLVVMIVIGIPLAGVMF